MCLNEEAKVRIFEMKKEFFQCKLKDNSTVLKTYICIYFCLAHKTISVVTLSNLICSQVLNKALLAIQQTTNYTYTYVCVCAYTYITYLLFASIEYV